MASPHASDHACPGASKGRIDWLFTGSLTAIVVLYGAYWLFPDGLAAVGWLHRLAHAVFALMNTVWWGIALGIVAIALLSRVPREFVMSALGPSGGLRGIWRASVAGVLLDLCSHGVLMVGAKLYERGASIGQVAAFLVASPWNSFSFALILIALVGIPWTLAFVVLSMVVAVVTGVVFERLVDRGILPPNPRKAELPEGFRFWPELRRLLAGARVTPAAITATLAGGVRESRMVLRWILLGVLLASAVRAFVPPDAFTTYFGPTVAGLGATLLVATVLEVCSEGSTPIAADLLTRAGAPGNSFAFLMGGVATDYTEIMVLREATRSWKIALFLPLVTLPQIIALGWLINVTAGQ